MANIRNEEDLKAWLQGKPPEVWAALAARAALRVLPVVGNAGHYRGDHTRDIVLPVFRAVTVSWSAAKYPAHADELLDAHRDAGSIAGHARHSPADGRAAATVGGRAATAAAGFAALSAASDDDSAACEAVANAADADSAVWSAVSTDAARIEEGVTASLMICSPLWPDGQPDGLRSLWQDMKEMLLDAEQDWEVWTGWYDDRLAGSVRDEERELAYVRIENDLWEQDPATVNAEIVRRIEGE
jgi:hypothetical protein